MFEQHTNGYFWSTVPDFSVIHNVVLGRHDRSSGHQQLIGDFCDLFV